MAFYDLPIHEISPYGHKALGRPAQLMVEGVSQPDLYRRLRSGVAIVSQQAMTGGGGALRLPKLS
jgi:hypothetical protein